MDFMTPANSALVRLRLRPIVESDHIEQPSVASVYEPGQLWAEPDIGHAAELMRRLCRDPTLRDRIGRAAAATVGKRYSHERVSSAMLARLQEINRSRCIPGALSRGSLAPPGATR